MKYLVFSDSHGGEGLMQAIVAKAVEGNDPCEGVIFLGDTLRDIRRVQDAHPQLDYHIVAGNCDFGSSTPLEKLVQLGGATILLTHGHRYGVKSGYERIATSASQMGADAAFFGHSHIPVITQKNGVLLLNPGSITEPRGGQKYRSYAIVEIIGGKITPKIVEVD